MRVIVRMRRQMSKQRFNMNDNAPQSFIRSTMDSQQSNQWSFCGCLEKINLKFKTNEKIKSNLLF